MTEYHKIQTVFKRDMNTKHKTLLYGAYSMPEFEYLARNLWVFTEKVDGTNIRVIWDAGSKSLVFGGKTDNAQIPAKLYEKLSLMFTEEDMERVFPDTSVCLYGEGYGAKIQKGGGNYRQDQSFVLFDVKIDRWWLERHNVIAIAETLGIDVVPIIGNGTLFDMVEMVKKGFDSQWGAFDAEGIVARPAVELIARNGQRIITKIKHRDFGGKP
jgi:hypothetical protein